MKTLICFKGLTEGHQFHWEKTFSPEEVRHPGKSDYCLAISGAISRRCDSGVIFVPGVLVKFLGNDFNFDVLPGVEYKITLRLQAKIDYLGRKRAEFRVVIEDPKERACVVGRIVLHFP